jgi:hypothetical protein
MPDASGFTRLPVIASFLLNEPHVAPCDRTWLRLRREHNDWNHGDLIRVRELLPTGLRWLLEEDRDE